MVLFLKSLLLYWPWTCSLGKIWDWQERRWLPPQHSANTPPHVSATVNTCIMAVQEPGHSVKPDNQPAEVAVPLRVQVFSRNYTSQLPDIELTKPPKTLGVNGLLSFVTLYQQQQISNLSQSTITFNFSTSALTMSMFTASISTEYNSNHWNKNIRACLK